MNNLRKQKNSKTQKGITLIALIITIIVMIILVGVSISVALNNGLFKATQSAAKNTEVEKIKETELSGGKVTIGNKNYGSIEDYIAGNARNAAYTTGQKVKVGNEMFYVIADSDETQDEVKLMTFDNIDTTNLVQSENAIDVAFSTESYWDELFNIVEPETIPASHIAAKAAADYGAKIGGVGRLMTYAEADSLIDGGYIAMIRGTETSSGYLDYWLGTSSVGDCVMCLKCEWEAFIDDIMGYDNLHGVRPIIEISKSLVSLP